MRILNIDPLFLKKNMWIISTVKFEYYSICIQILGVIVCKLNYEQESYLVILLSINKSSKISLYLANFSVAFAICLKIKDSEKFLFYI